jgi:hypothetical protein
MSLFMIVASPFNLVATHHGQRLTSRDCNGHADENRTFSGQGTTLPGGRRQDGRPSRTSADVP